MEERTVLVDATFHAIDVDVPDSRQCEVVHFIREMLAQLIGGRRRHDSAVAAAAATKPAFLVVILGGDPCGSSYHRFINQWLTIASGSPCAAIRLNSQPPPWHIGEDHQFGLLQWHLTIAVDEARLRHQLLLLVAYGGRSGCVGSLPSANADLAYGPCLRLGNRAGFAARQGRPTDAQVVDRDAGVGLRDS